MTLNNKRTDFGICRDGSHQVLQLLLQRQQEQVARCCAVMIVRHVGSIERVGCSHQTAL